MSESIFQVHPSHCPACGAKMDKGCVIVCRPCFFSVGGDVRSRCVNQAFRTKLDPKAMEGTGRKVIRLARERRVARNMSVPNREPEVIPVLVTP